MEFPLPCLIPGGYTLVHHCIILYPRWGEEKNVFQRRLWRCTNTRSQDCYRFPGLGNELKQGLNRGQSVCLGGLKQPRPEWKMVSPSSRPTSIACIDAKMPVCTMFFAEHGSSAKTIQNMGSLLKWSCSNFDDPRGIPIYWTPTSCHPKKGRAPQPPSSFRWCHLTQLWNRWPIAEGEQRHHLRLYVIPEIRQYNTSAIMIYYL